jgi:tetratricopeptide (TPR) repeat protein
MDTSSTKGQPFIRYDYFVGLLSPLGRRMLYGLQAILVLAAVLLVLNYHMPTLWHQPLATVADTQLEEVILEPVTSQYRQLNILGRAHSHYLTYTAPRMVPNMTVVLLCFGLIVLAWACLLAAASRMEGLAGYAIYFLFTSWIYISGTGALIGGTTFQMLWAAVIMLVVLGVAYLFRARILPWSTPYQIPVFGAMLAIVFGVIYGINGLAGLYKASTTGLPILLVLVLFALLMTSRNLLNLVLLLLNNRSTAARRSPGWLVMLALLLAAAFQIMLALPYLDFLGFELPFHLGIRPVHVFVLASVCNIVLIQNVYADYRDQVPSLGAFVALVIGLNLLALATWALFAANQEFTFRTQIERTSAMLFALVGILQLIYIFINFYPAISKKVNVYYTLSESRLFRFEAVWLSAITLFVLVEGQNRWRLYYSMITAYKNASADYSLMVQEPNDALIFYNDGLGFSPHDIKSNFNRASLLIERGKFYQDDNESFQIIKHYEDADYQGQYAPACINLGNFWQLLAQNERAKSAYRTHLQIQPDPYIASNLARYYLNDNQPDSALVFLKSGLQDNLELGELYSNMAIVYRRYGKFREAEQFMALAQESAPANDYILENAQLLALLRRQIPAAGSQLTPEITNRPTLNGALLAYRQSAYRQADQLATTLLRTEPSAEVALLKVMTQTEVDSMENAISRYRFLTEQYPDYKGVAGHNLGVYYLKKEVPEMAANYFEQSVAGGFQLNRLNEAYMYLDAGLTDKGYTLLAQFKIDNPDLASRAAREMALVELAEGNETAAKALWDMNDMTLYEAIRLARYGFNMQGNEQLANTYLQTWVDKDSSLVEPYLEIARFFLQEKSYEEADKLVGYGLDRQPKHIPLLLTRAEIYIASKQQSKAQAALKQLESLSLNRPQKAELLRLQAQLAQESGNADETEKLLLEAFQLNPYSVELLRPLAELYAEQKAWKKGYDIVGKAFDLNNRNEWIWYYLGLFSAKNDMTESAIAAYQQAIEWSTDKQRIAQYRKALTELQAQGKEE